MGLGFPTLSWKQRRAAKGSWADDCTSSSAKGMPWRSVSGKGALAWPSQGPQSNATALTVGYK